MIAVAATLIALISSVIGGNATALETAERMGEQIVVDVEHPPPGLDLCDEMAWYIDDVGLPDAFHTIGFGESRCINRPDVRTWCCHGWFQLWIDLHLQDHRLAPLYAECGITSKWDVNGDTPDDKKRQACGAKALYDTMGTSPWKATRP